MANQVLRVRLRDKQAEEASIPLVPDFERHDAGTMAYVGAKFIEKDGQYAFEATGEEVELPVRPEYISAIRKGLLVPADEATAKLTGTKLAKTKSTTTTKGDAQ